VASEWVVVSILEYPEMEVIQVQYIYATIWSQESSLVGGPTRVQWVCKVDLGNGIRG